MGFNTIIIDADQIRLPIWLLVAASGMVSLFGAHLILTRWLEASGRTKLDGTFDNAKASARRRGCYTWGVIRSYLRDFPYVVMELSGALFYLLLMTITFVGVIYRAL